MAERPTLYLIDGSSYIYRAYFAIRHLSSPSGFPTNAIYGFTQMLLKVMKDRRPDHIAVVFDAGRATFRHDLYADYKANRVAMPDDLVPQIEPIKEMVRAFNIPVIELQGYEADDIIATIARECGSLDLQTVVVTGDKDLMQIVNDRVVLLDTMKDKVSGVREVEERFGVGPDRVVEILGLAGDSSDNIPGVPGIGEKTAIKLIQEFGTMEQLLERVSEVKGKVGERLKEFAEQARLSRRLATVDSHVPISCMYDRFAVATPDNRRLGQLFKEYGFTTLMKELTSEATFSAEQYRTIVDEASFADLLRELEGVSVFALDLQTAGPNPLCSDIIGISLSFREHEAWYVPFGDGATCLSLRQVLQGLGPLLCDPGRKKAGHNIKVLNQVLCRTGVAVQGLCFDTMLASYLLNPVRSSHGLDSLSVEFLDHRMISYEEMAGKGKDQLSFSHIPMEKGAAYACERVDAVWLLYGLFAPRLVESGMEQLYYDVELPLALLLGDIECSGVKLDLPLLDQLSRGFGEQLALLETEIFSLAGGPFNVGSPKQLGEVLFDTLKLPSGKKTKGKTGWSTDMDVLTTLAEDHRIARLVLEYRSLAKLKSTYTDALAKQVDPKTSRIHTSYNQAVTSTGRLSSSEPNLQNIPIRSEEGRKIRRAFIAEPGCLLLSADYSQIELRVLAHLSEDRVFCESFERDEDIHTRTASEVFGLFPEMVTAEMRRQAKAINFGIIYGQGAFGLAREIGVTPKVAREFIDNYFSRHTGARAFLDGCIRGAERNGYVTTLLGRRLPIPDINSANGNIRSFAQRNAVNYPIQGSAADIIKQAMVRVRDRMLSDKVESRLIMQVHDELVFEVAEHELLHMEQLVRFEMEHAVSLRVPLRVDVSHGRNWSEAH